MATKLISWNVNGIRACDKAGFLDWLKREGADVVCLQETKANRDQLHAFLLRPEGYETYWHSAQKPGYSGVAIYTRQAPLSVKEGMGIEKYDSEGRVLLAEYPDFTLINAYFPNSQRDHARLPYKLAFCRDMLRLCEELRSRGRKVIVCGDFNIAHTEIDLRNPKSNANNAGFLPQERAWMTEYIQAGYLDTFRQFTPDPGHYTWWSYRPGVREKNVGWRLDYFFAGRELAGRLRKAEIHPHVRGSDHCPVSLELA
jgi:exodeoxyribonuclease-3